MTHHPLRDVGILVYHCPEAPESDRYRAFYTDKKLCIYFPRSSHREAYNAALHWQNEQIERHEYTYRQRREAAAKARAARKQKQ